MGYSEVAVLCVEVASCSILKACIRLDRGKTGFCPREQGVEGTTAPLPVPKSGWSIPSAGLFSVAHTKIFEVYIILSDFHQGKNKENRGILPDFLHI